MKALVKIHIGNVEVLEQTYDNIKQPGGNLKNLQIETTLDSTPEEYVGYLKFIKEKITNLLKGVK